MFVEGLFSKHKGFIFYSTVYLCELHQKTHFYTAWYHVDVD